MSAHGNLNPSSQQFEGVWVSVMYKDQLLHITGVKVQQDKYTYTIETKWHVLITDPFKIISGMFLSALFTLSWDAFNNTNIHMTSF